MFLAYVRIYCIHGIREKRFDKLINLFLVSVCLQLKSSLNSKAVFLFDAGSGPIHRTSYSDIASFYFKDSKKEREKCIFLGPEWY